MEPSTGSADLQPLITRSLSQTRAVVDALSAATSLHQTLARLAHTCVRSLRQGGKILLAGNGGSAADSQHIAAELVGRFLYDRPALAAIALTTDTSALTAIGNDYGYESVFARQLQALGRSGDVFIGLSTSGNSANVMAAIRAANAAGITTVGFTGRSGGQMRSECGMLLDAPSTHTPDIQVCHIMLGHLLCDLIEQSMFTRT